MAKAISLSPTQKFEGDDGQWSTFYIMVGDDPQAYRILPATSQSATWVIAVDACNSSISYAVPPDCDNLRGGTFDRTVSDSEINMTAISTSEGWSMPYTELEKILNPALIGTAGYGGIGSVTLGGQVGDAKMVEQAIAMPVDKIPFFGLLGLVGRPSQVTPTRDVPSALMELKSSNKTPSLYWAYHAGAYYADPPLYGSLTFGGYDSARGDVTSFVLPFYAENEREFLVNIQAVTIPSLSSTATQTLPNATVNAIIDSMVTEIWLPVDLCQAFEKHLNITWDESYELYLLDEDQHQSLVDLNPNITFALAVNSSAPESSWAYIDLPYAAFDLKISPSLTGLNTSSEYNSTELYYFPLKQAANDSQYVLGRTFLQAVYMAANYENKTFSLSQATLTQESNIVTVWTNTTDSNNHNTTTPVVDENGDGGLSAGAIAGIAVGSIIAAIAAFALFYWLCWRPRKRRGKAPPPHYREDSLATFQTGTDTMVAPGDTWSRTQSTGIDPLWVLNDRKLAQDEQEVKPELDATFTSRMRAPSEATQKHELPADSVGWPSPGRGSISPMVERRPGHERTTSDTPSFGVSTLGPQSPPLASPSPPLSEATGWLEPVYELHAMHQTAPYEVHADEIARPGAMELQQGCPSTASTPKIIAEDPPRESISVVSEIEGGNEVERATTPSRPETPVAETGPGTRLL